MFILKNAFYNVLRNRGRNLLIGSVIFHCNRNDCNCAYD